MKRRRKRRRRRNRRGGGGGRCVEARITLLVFFFYVLILSRYLWGIGGIVALESALRFAGPFLISPSSSVKTYVDNPLNRKLGCVGLPVGSAVHGKDPSPPSSPDSSSVKVYKDNALNRRLDRVGEPMGTAVYSKKKNPSGSPIQLERRVYTDNAFNRKHNRVGLPWRSKPVSRGDLVYQDNPLNRKHDRVGLPLGSQIQNSRKKLQTLRKLLGPEEKARGMDWTMIRESTVLSYSSDKTAGHPCTPILSLSPSTVPVRGNPRDVITVLAQLSLRSQRQPSRIWKLLFCLQALK
ncbi:serine/threonine-protein kinase ctr1 [Plakobranchus ocellatus]|uniref:Serine/threonine-protein kinase ctr1 n=1 Tax=Plakobranchus ocellatus TaxID=259542 RepID=A0AAV3ZNF8_9GAST|nr:serine/threonine-protein kinase ctr1 [Plakobranchus ocellatus]